MIDDIYIYGLYRTSRNGSGVTHTAVRIKDLLRALGYEAELTEDNAKLVVEGHEFGIEEVMECVRGTYSVNSWEPSLSQTVTITIDEGAAARELLVKAGAGIPDGW